MNKWRNWKRLMAVMLTTVMTVGLLAACSFGKGENTSDDQERVLRIAYSAGYNSSYGNWLRTTYTELFEFVNPNITIEFIENVDQSQNYNYMRPMPVDGGDQEQPKTPMELLSEQLDGANPPDLIIMEYADMSALIRENRLAPLDPLMQNSGVATDEFVPTVVDSLKKLSDDGRLYGLAPLFSSSVLGYNKQMFIDKGLAFPTDGMTWDQMFNLAEQLSEGEGADQKYGFAFSNYRYNDIFYDMGTYTAPLGLQYWDEKGERMTVNTPEWIDTWKTFYRLNDEKVMPGQPDWSQPQPENQNPFAYNSMLSGNVAMMILNYWDITEIINVNKNAATIENFTPVDWDVVSVPYHEEAPYVGGNVTLSGIMGVTSNAQNSADAWALIEFVMSERWAQQKSKTEQQLVTWKKYNAPRDGLDYNLEAFYLNTPAVNPMDYNNEIWRTKPDIGQAQWMGQTKFQEVINGDKTVEVALQEWETEGNAILQALMDNNGRLGEDYWNNLYGGGSMSIERQMLMEASGEVFFEEAPADEVFEEDAIEEEVTETSEGVAE